jgi:hypothetical protein
MDILKFFVDIAAMAAGVVLVVDFLIRYLKIGTAVIFKTITARQLLSWIVALLGCLAGVIWNLGMFAEVPTWQFIVYGFAVGLVSNGFADVTLVKTILDVILKFLPKKE